MGRKEKPLDPSSGPLGEFADSLRSLRAEAGVTYRQMAAATHYSASALARAANGNVRPSWDLVLAYVAACGSLPTPADEPPADAAATGRMTFTDHVQASEWLDAEHANLVAAVVDAAARGSHRAAYRLADALRGYLYLRACTVDWQVVAEAAVAAAESDGNTA
jgi:transcriptional regulator with XRE-family HTH domain